MYFASQLKHVLEGTTYKGGLFVIPQREIFEKKTQIFSHLLSARKRGPSFTEKPTEGHVRRITLAASVSVFTGNWSLFKLFSI